MNLFADSRTVEQVPYYEGVAAKRGSDVVQVLMPRIIQEELSPQQRICTELFYYEGLNMREIGERCGLDRSTVSRNLLRARRKIKSSLRYALEVIDVSDISWDYSAK